MNDLLNILSSAIALLFTIIVHEVAHGYAALIFKDTTAKDMGRLSINPLKHLSLPGLISLYIFKFGWAKPVPVDFNRLRPRKLGFFVVSIAGIFTNLILCFISCLIFVKVNFSNGSFLYNLFLELILYNAGLAVFNLLPFPPLDGSKVILSFFPKNTQDYILRNEKFLYTILLILIFTGTISKVIQPITSKIIIFFYKYSELINLYEIKLKEYEGPLDLLIDLIEKDKIDIYDIPISSITSKFINEIEKFEKDKENLSEFILLASTLIEIKGLMLLPKESLDEDPRINLTIMIEEYQKFKILSKKLYEYFEEASLSRTKDRQVIETTYTTVNISEDIQKLKDIFEDIIRRKKVSDNIFIDKKIIKKDEYSIIDSKNTIINKLIKNNRLSFNEILNINDPKLKIITDFFAILEIIKLNTAFIVHENGNIFLQIVKGEA